MHLVFPRPNAANLEARPDYDSGGILTGEKQESIEAVVGEKNGGFWAAETLDKDHGMFLRLEEFQKSIPSFVISKNRAPPSIMRSMSATRMMEKRAFFRLSNISINPEHGHLIVIVNEWVTISIGVKIATV